MPKYTQPEVKVFRDSHELDMAIADFERLTETVQSLPPGSVRFNDARLEAANDLVQRVIGRTFGTNSIEFQQLGYMKINQYGSQYIGMEDYEFQEQFVAAHAHSLAKLHGLLDDLKHKRATWFPYGVMTASLADIHDRRTHGRSSTPPHSVTNNTTHVHGPNYGTVMNNAAGAQLTITQSSSSAEVQSALAGLRAQFEQAQKPGAVEIVEVLHQQAALPKTSRTLPMISMALSGIQDMTSFLADAAPALLLVEAIRHWFN